MPEKDVIRGGHELERNLKKLGSGKLVAKVTRSAIGKAGTKLKKVAKTMVVVETGLLRESIHSMTKTKSGVIYGVVGARSGLSMTVTRTRDDGTTYEIKSDPSKYSHLVELGTAHSQAKPFLRPAFDSVDSEKIISDKLWENIAKEVDKMKVKVL